MQLFVLVNENISNNTTREQMERKDPSATLAMRWVGFKGIVSNKATVQLLY